MRVGYCRVSSVDQSLARQDLGDCERVFEEKLSGGSTDRPALQDMIAFVRFDDEVVVHSIDRLARNLMDLLKCNASFDKINILMVSQLNLIAKMQGIVN